VWRRRSIGKYQSAAGLSWCNNASERADDITTKLAARRFASAVSTSKAPVSAFQKQEEQLNA